MTSSSLHVSFQRPPFCVDCRINPANSTQSFLKVLPENQTYLIAPPLVYSYYGDTLYRVGFAGGMDVLANISFVRPMSGMRQEIVKQPRSASHYYRTNHAR